MNDIEEKLKSFDNDKLIDIVKNYRQYGYSNEIRNIAIETLESRGLDKDVLKLSDNLNNKSYDDAESYFQLFESSSKKAFISYVLILLIRAIFPIMKNSSESIQLILVISFWLILILYIIFLIKSFTNQSKYYTTINKKDSQLNAGLYFTVGAAFYFVMYFVFRKQMKEDINLIR